MPQKTNLNISPYYDDFDKEDKFYRVLFKPGFPVQARELTTLQSSLQNQIETFGSHIFKDGSMVVPGNINFDPQYHSVRILDTHLGIPVNLYLDQLIGLKLKGRASGIILTIDSYQLIGRSTEVDDLTIYVKYIQSGTDNQISNLTDGEQLIVQESFVYGNTAVNEGETVLTLVDNDASAIGSAVGISSGTYFIRGTFVDVSTDKIVLDPYTNTPSYRVGLNIDEQLITAKNDDSLYDNARGFSNFAAPGADRLKITTTLGKKSLTDFNDTNFIELLRIDDGKIKKIVKKSDYSLIRDYFAQRTFDESGNYTVEPFDVQVFNSLNNGLSNGGIFRSNEVTNQQNTPSDDLMCVKISAGKAYVKGYDINLGDSTIIDVEKPRDKQKVDASLVPYQMGTILRVNHAFGVPKSNINYDTYYLEFYNQRTGSNTSGTGELVGRARVYSFAVSDAAYSGDASEWDLHLFDMQTFTRLVLNQAVSNTELPDTSFVRGLSSGATGYAIAAGGASTIVKLTQVTGRFVQGEQIIINEDSEISRSIQTVRTFGIQDIKSVYQDISNDSGYNSDFVADTVLQRRIPTGFSITDELNITAGIATCAGRSFTGIKTDTIIRYQLPNETVERFNRISSISADGLSITLASVANATGICNGSVPTDQTTTTFAFGVPNINLNENKGLYAELGNRNVSDISLSTSNLVIGKNITGRTTDANGTLTVNLGNSGISSAFYDNFDAERYSVHYSDGSIEPLTQDQFVLGTDGQSFSINGLTPNESNIVVSTTLKKQSLKSKVKNYIRSEKLEVVKTARSINTSLTGMDKATGYGLRVEDKEISLNIPDVVKVLGVFESTNTNVPTLDRLIFPDGLDLNNTAILGEKIIGDSSDAIAQITGLISATEVEIVYLTQTKFTSGEVCNFDESGISTILSTITVGNNLDITNRFELDKGQREQFYDYSRLVRRVNFPPPTRKVLVVYDKYSVASNDDGDFCTVASYDEERFSNDIPLLKDGLRATDTIDFRPRVAKYTGAESPFAFKNRTFATSGNNPSFVVAPNESSIVEYNFYLPRIDKIILDTLGNLGVVKGTSSTVPATPPTTSEGMEIATIELPAYLYNPDDAIVRVVDNTRYTMKDIGKLEDRIETLEETTSLSLLELDTKTLQVQDVDGLSRFKTGFFVDDFKNIDLLDRGDPDCKVTVDPDNRELFVPLDFWSMKPELALNLTTNVETADFSQDLELLDTNVQKTGDLITVAYEEVDWLNQPLASRVENVNPFNMVEFTGLIDLKPFDDSWVRTIEVDGGVVRVTGGRRQRISVVGAIAGGIAEGLLRATVPIFGIVGAIFGGLFGRRRTRVTTRTERVLTSQEPDPHIRSRNVAFTANNLRPVARFYPFFDGTSGIDIVPKLLEISMTNGIFSKGETVEAYDENGEQVAIFRIAQPDHKLGDINSPSETFNANPYDTTLSLGSVYSASSTVLNIDVLSMADEAQGKFFGYIPTSNVTLLGQSSGAQAEVANVRLVADTYGDLYGSFFFRNPLADPPPPLRFKTGTSSFKLTSSPENAEPLPGSLLISSGETSYQTEGRVDTFTTTIVQTVSRRRCRFFFDPLAQSFTTDESGAFVTSVDLFFGSKDPSQKLIVELRTMELGIPTNTLVTDYSRVVVNPDDINVSNNAEIPTTVKFPSPVYLEPGTEYAIVLLSPTTNLYEAWIAQMGERTVNTQSLPDAESVIVTRQYVGGSLFKSQNGTIWTASQFEDLKFKLRKAKFSTTAGTAFFYNPRLEKNSGIIERLLPNSIKTLPRKLKVGITTTTHASSIAKMVPGVQVSDATTGNPIQGFIEKVGGPINTFSITNAGTGYKPNLSGINAVANVSLYAITGRGTDATATIETNASGEVSSITLTSNTAGSGYAVGDVIGISTVGFGTHKKGTGAEITVTAINGVSTLYLNNVQGEEFTTGQPIVVYESGTATSYGSTTITSSTVYDDKYRGNIVEVQHYNHGMQADTNLVTLANIEPDTPPVPLTDFLDVDDQVVSIADTTSFATFNGISTSQGFMKINNEIIFYNSVGVNQLGIGTRGVDNTVIRTHDVDTISHKYELNGYDLTKINTDHNMTNISALSKERGIDSYYLELNRGGLANGDSQVSFTKEQNVGGENIFASKNYQFNIVAPQFSVLTPSESTTVTASVRTVSGTSAGGGEVPFIDQGYEPITLNQPNPLNTPRIVCSRVNENTRLTGLPLNRSFTIGIRMETSDPNLSPVLDTLNANVVYIRSRLNKPIDDYTKDARSNATSGDPHSGVYISNRVDLKNPATSLKVLVSAYRDESADFRVLYQLFREDGGETEIAYELFPGYDNLNDTDGDGFGDQVIDNAKNSGRSDAFVSGSRFNEFKEYQFSVDDLDEFTGFKIKIVCSGTNEALAPRFQDFRAIALA